MTFDIRPAVQGDYPQLCELFDELDALHRDARPDIFRRPGGDARSREDVADLIAGEGGTILVAEGPRGLVGLAVALLRSPLSHPVLVARKVVVIDNVVVRHDHRRQGIGRALVEKACRLARERGVGEFHICTEQDNVIAQRLYTSAGADVVGLQLEIDL